MFDVYFSRVFCTLPLGFTARLSQENYEAGFKESARIFFEREERKVSPAGAF